MIPEKIDRYEIKNELGRGGMATVFEAYDPRFERQVAVKVLPREFMHDPEFRARFTREARTIAALEHPAIVPVYDFGEEDNQPFLVMRLMNGGSLTDRLQNGPIEIEEAAEILKRIGSALDRAHSQGIVHRDLKPSNILFDHYGEAFLADFGIVRVASASSQLTASGSLVGTPSYMSPEQVYGNKKVDGRADIYALGVILYQMLTGDVPYDADTPARMMMAHVMDPIPHLMDKRPDLPSDCDQVITKAMAKERDDRYPTASDLTNDLTAATQKMSRPDLPSPPTAAEPTVESAAPSPPTSATAETAAPATTPPPLPIPDDEPTTPPPPSIPEDEPDSAFDEPTYAHELITPGSSGSSDGTKIPVWLWVVLAIGAFLCLVSAIGISLILINSFSNDGDEGTATAVSNIITTPEATTDNDQSVFEDLDDTPSPEVEDTPTTEIIEPTPEAADTAISLEAAAALATRQAAEATRDAAATGTDETDDAAADALATRESAEATRDAIAEDRPEYFLGGFDQLTPLVGPLDGELPHEPEDDRVEMFYPDLSPQDFILNVNFLNPFPAQTGDWDFGVAFRQVSPDEELRLVVRSDGLWNLNNRQPEGDNFIHEGDVSDILDLDEDGANQLTLIISGETGYFFLNEQFIDTLDLSFQTAVGDIALGTGFYTVDEQEGAMTEYEDFAIWPVTPIFGPDSGEMAHELDDLIKLAETDINERNLLIHTTFLNPFAANENDWDYGFSFRDDDDGTKYWLIVASEGYWELVSRFGDADSDETVQDGDLENLHLGEGDNNQLTLIVWGEVGFFFVNGEFIEELDLSDITHTGDAEVMTAYYFDHELEGAATGYEELTVWPLP
ncbi:MAG: serine/threonine protein kinase [Chloroflexi bacterium]|nr:serine/threonine protein kinase [Chloroflexota bacterium]